jgi:hypothetical protein
MATTTQAERTEAERTTKPETKPQTALVLRTCSADMTSHGGFRWPESGSVECSDWIPEPVCGYGLHGLLWGEGDGSLLDWASDAKWLVVEVDAGGVVDLKGKVKFPRGSVVHCGDRLSATAYLSERAPGRAIVGGTATAGDHGTATAGDHGTATAGYGGTATAGDRGTATAGDHGTATAGDHGTATAGYGGTATAGYGGTATAGDHGTATAGVGGTATAGDHGILSLRWWDGNRYRIATLYVGEDGIGAGQPYRVDENGRAVKTEKTVKEAA